MVSDSTPTGGVNLPVEAVSKAAGELECRMLGNRVNVFRHQFFQRAQRVAPVYMAVGRRHRSSVPTLMPTSRATNSNAAVYGASYSANAEGIRTTSWFFRLQTTRSIFCEFRTRAAKYP